MWWSTRWTVRTMVGRFGACAMSGWWKYTTSTKISLSVECRGRSPTRWRIAGIANSGKSKGLTNIKCTASMHWKGTPAAVAISWDGCASWALTNSTIISWAWNWKRWSAVVKRLYTGSLGAGCSGVLGNKDAGTAGLASDAATLEACGTSRLPLALSASGAEEWRTNSWKPSPCLITCWGCKVFGISSHPKVTVHGW